MELSPSHWLGFLSLSLSSPPPHLLLRNIFFNESLAGQIKYTSHENMYVTTKTRKEKENNVKTNQLEKLYALFLLQAMSSKWHGMDEYILGFVKYLEIFILEHDSRVRVLVKNDGGVMERRWRDDGGNGMWRTADVESCSNLLMM